MPWTCPTCKHVFDVGPSVPITPPEAPAEACQGCKGTGEVYFTGFSETCRMCGGDGRAHYSPPAEPGLRERVMEVLSSTDFRTAFEDYLSLPPRAGDEKECRIQARELVEIVRVQVASALAHPIPAANTEGLREAAREVLESAGPSDLGKVQVTQHSLEQLDAALRTPPQKP